MKSRLKNLYKYLIENRKHEVKGWHDAYRECYGQVGQIRERIKSGEGLSHSILVALSAPFSSSLCFAIFHVIAHIFSRSRNRFFSC